MRRKHIAHVVTSQFIAWLEEKARLPSRQRNAGDSFILPLCPFLHDKTSTFWHELSCFAEGCYKMETYDAVVEYRQQKYPRKDMNVAGKASGAARHSNPIAVPPRKAANLDSLNRTNNTPQLIPTHLTLSSERVHHKLFF
ncbi:hypothetical protein RIF29_29222 [Crotalaria pallida]|uniref:RING-type E3 ubiquitin transferase n=1 Tax=Crotalaria pallida TaxID=3830 RepID=A0AAN9EEE7_CROPI